ncbi:MAG: hypothetical protein DCF25_05895 [Leptolyngbya foveolarum]|uniref:Uncharacterized protein n=1 Tax=Leptolyngbya foveolarum TaxID=47253 RepID=A0A2W4WEQ4_9CYAN|nr:MAG: hypothetical protein DCF25_05895 [Leptolyngbya foveolarum]
MSRELSTNFGTGPLTPVEKQQLSQTMAQLPASDQQAIRAGVKCLPKEQRERATLEWSQRWKA